MIQSKFPATRYQGSKVKLVDWIWANIENIEFNSCLDAFGGTGAVSYRLKQKGKSVTYNDLLRFNYNFGVALIENEDDLLSQQAIEWLLTSHDEIDYPTFIQDTFEDIYYTKPENAWLDKTITNIKFLDDFYCRSLAFFALAQSCIIKRPYNLFHRKNLYMRLADVERSFGNKTSWDKPFTDWFKHFAQEANNAVFKGSGDCRATNLDALCIPNDYDLVYIDTPYISAKGTPVDYAEFYHFLEGLCLYEAWGELIDWQTKHRRLKKVANPWSNKNEIYGAFDKLFARFSESVIVVSYRNDGIPSLQELYTILKKYKTNIRVDTFGQYKYALSKNSRSREVLLIGNR